MSGVVNGAQVKKGPPSDMENLTGSKASPVRATRCRRSAISRVAICGPIFLAMHGISGHSETHRDCGGAGAMVAH
jgi:hypothetical protein